MQGIVSVTLIMTVLGVFAVWVIYSDMRIRQRSLMELMDQRERDLLIRYKEVEAMMNDLLMPASPTSRNPEAFQSYLESVPRLTPDTQRALAPTAALRHKSVEDLLSKGFEVEHIARDMGMGKGEVMLIANLMKKTAV